MLSVEELEAENEASTDSQSAALSQGSVGPPPSTEPQASAAVPVVPRSAPTAPPTVPAQPPYHYAHPGGGVSGYGNNGLNARAGKKFSNRGKNNSGMGSVQQGNPGYPAMMQYGMYGQDPNSMLYTMNGPYGSPGMMQVQPGQVAGHSAGALDGSVVSSGGVGASGATIGANNQDGIGSDVNVNIASMPANGVGNNSVQQAMQYQTQPGMIQAYSGMGAFPHPPQQKGSGYAAAYQMGGMYGAPAGWNGGYPNQFAQVGYAQNPNVGGRGPVGVGGFPQHSANGAVARMQGYGGMDPTGQGYAYGMTGNMDYNTFGGHHHGPGKGGHKSKTATNNRSNHHNHNSGNGSNTTATGGVGVSDYPKGASGSSGGAEGRVGGGNSQDVRASMGRGVNSSASLHGGVAKPGNSLEAGVGMGTVSAATGVVSGASSNSSNSNNWNTGGQDMMWAQQQMQYQQQMAMMNGQYQQQQAPYQQNSGYGAQANWR